MQKSNQIGGKGSVRRKKVVKRNRNFQQKKSQEQLKLENRIININNLLDKIDKEYKNIAIISINDIILSNFDDLEKYDVKKKDNYKIIKNNVIEFFENNFVNKTSEFYRYRSNVYLKLKEFFIQDCIPYILDIFIEIENYLNKKDYLNLDKDSDKIELSDKDCFDLLNLDYTENPSKDQLKKAYKIKIRENHPDKHPTEKEKYEEIFSKISVAYKLLKQRYL